MRSSSSWNLWQFQAPYHHSSPQLLRFPSIARVNRPYSRTWDDLLQEDRLGDWLTKIRRARPRGSWKFRSRKILWMEDIPNNHLTCMQLCKLWDVYHINCCRIFPINSMLEGNQHFDWFEFLQGLWVVKIDEILMFFLGSHVMLVLFGKRRKYLFCMAKMTKRSCFFSRKYRYTSGKWWPSFWGAQPADPRICSRFILPWNAMKCR